MSSRKLGDFEIVSLSDGFFRLDGGAMFGIVPKPLWEKRIAPDDRNRITMGLRCLLVRTPSANVLVDTGIGSGFDPRQADLLGIEHPPDLLSSLAAAGLSPHDVSVVINTHLHFDHAGGNTAPCGDGRRVPAFSRARYLVSGTELKAARDPGERSRASYHDTDWAPLLDAGVLETFDGATCIAPGVRVVPTPGHTPGHSSVVVESRGETAMFLGDLVPTTSHFSLAWVMGYDLEPRKTVDLKKEWLGRCADSGWLAALEHDRSTAFCLVRRTAKGFEAEPA